MFLSVWVKKLAALLEIGGMKKDILCLVLSALALIASLLDLFPFLPFDPAWVAILLCGIPIVLEAIIGLVTAFDIKADVLVSLALIASVCIGETFAAGEVAVIMQLGALLEEWTVSKARAGIERLVHLTPRTARLLTANGEKEIPAEQVQVGDRLRVLPGETIPVDGILRNGETSVNQAVMTGESIPVDKAPGDEVLSGTVNQFGAFEMETTRVGQDSSIQRMIRLVQSADAGKAKIVGLADRWATWIVITALTAAGLTWLFTGQLIRAVTILVVFCPCSLVLATPTAIMAAIGNATKHGFLVREGDALERLSKVKRIAFDKTGTLTLGTPKVTAVRCLAPGWTEQGLYSLAVAAEQYSEHPLGKAILADYRKDPRSILLPAEDFHMIPGQGVSARVKGHSVKAGNRKLLSQAPADCSALLAEAETEVQKGCTLIYLLIDEKPAGYLALSDTLREESKDLIQATKELGVTPVLLTGDHQHAALEVAGSLGIQEVQANCLPEDKLQFIDASQKNQEPICMIGDGVNDAPALKKADVGIAMGGIGSDIAVDAADIALVDDQVREIPHLLALSKHMMTTIKRNLTFSMALNFIAIALAITGLMGPITGALVHNAGSVLVIVNSAALLRMR